MTPTSKDFTGFALVACALALLGARTVVDPSGDGEEGIQRTSTVSLESLSTHETQARGADAARGLERQTVVLRDGVVVEVGSVGEVGVPADAFVVDGFGSTLLLPATVGPRTDARIDPWRPVSPGVRTDLLLVPAGPTEGRHHPEGVLVGARWYPRADARRSASVPGSGGGH